MKDKHELFEVIDIADRKYSVSNNGYVINNKTGKRIKTYLNKKKKGYVYVKLQDGLIQRSRHVGNLVGIYFVDNPQNKPAINHEDGNKLNNHYLNLKWVTNKENTKHAVETGLIKSKKYKQHKEEEYEQQNK